MARLARLGLCACVAFFLVAGCPIVPADVGVAGPDTGSEQVIPSGTGGSSGGAAAGSTVASGGAAAGPATLLAEFPDCGEPASAAGWTDEVLRLVNKERTGHGLVALVWNQALEQEAAHYACEMIHYDFFAHTNPVTGTTLADRAVEFGYEYQVVGENLAAGPRSPGDVMEAWMGSEGHRANILDPRFTEIGIAVRSGGQYGLYWVQEFGLPRQ